MLTALGRGEDVRTGGLLASPERVRRASVGPRSLRGLPGIRTPYGIQRQQHAITCRFMACEGAKDGEGAAARSLRAVRTTSGSAVALRPVLVMGRPSGMQPRPSASGAFDVIICGPSLEPVNVGAVTVHFLDRDKTRRTCGRGRPPPRRPTPTSKAEMQTLLHGDEDLVGNKTRTHRKNPVLGIG